MKNSRILLISSANPLVGPGGMAMDAYKALSRMDYSVDFYTKYPVSGNETIRSFCSPRKSLRLRIRDTLFFRMITRGCFLFYGREEHPPVPINQVVDAVKGQYDLMIIMFWQDLLSFATVEALFDKLKCPVLFFAVDASISTGGCHYPNKCMKYQTGCGRCSALKWPILDHFTKHNVLFRKRFYDKVHPMIMANTYMRNQYFAKSQLLRDFSFEPSFPVIDEEKFCPKDKKTLRNKYGIPDQKRFILFAGAQNISDERKGGVYLKQALTLFVESLSSSLLEEVLLITAGRQTEDLDLPNGLDYLHMGFVSLTALSDLYALSDVFLCPSVEDAGPMMVNQSLSCGTPVVMFQMGAAFDVIDGKGTGYCAKLRDVNDFCRGIRLFYEMEQDKRAIVSSRCREVALQTTSYGAFGGFVNNILNRQDYASR